MPRPQIIEPKPSSRSVAGTDLRPATATLLIGGGTGILLATILDLAVLWAVQRQPNAQWEFTAVVTTLDHYSLLLIGLGAILGGCYLRGVDRRWVAVSVGLIALVGALGAVGLGLLLAKDFLAIRKVIEPDAIAGFRAAVVKGLSLVGIYTLTLGQAGQLALKR
ncbi:MAG TPA: hypothetical protein VLT17_11480 [Gemmatimonadales bacterium]|nr:hypothetical protein [Gemmatimonadales bacterium]